ncbi:MAG: alpha/beta hydrolase [Phycisphaerae bacterium]
MPKPTLLMVHGLAGSLDYFDPAGRIAHARVETLDLLGYGVFRDAAQDRLTLQSQAEHVASRAASLSDGPLWLLGHSMGGAVVMLMADQRPELVTGIINVEGNFTLKDAFWSSRIIARPLAEWSRQYRAMQQDIHKCAADWGIEPSEKRIECVTSILEHQPAATIYAMSKALIEETCVPAYLDAVRRVVERGVPIHLIAGERSAKDWDIPDFVRSAARSYTEIAHAGHLMMLEEPDAFCRTVDSILPSVHGAS